MSGLSRSSAITGLPKELLIMVLFRVRKATSARSFVSILLCCRYWFYTGRDILYGDIVLASATIITFMERFPYQCFSKIRTITISVDGQDKQLSESLVQDFCRLWCLVPALKNLTRLNTLSFTVLRTSDRDGSPYCPTKPDFIRALLANLPKSVANLNMDIAGYGIGYPFNDSSILEELERIAPKLHILRLRLTYLDSHRIWRLLKRQQVTLKILHVDTHTKDGIPLPSRSIHEISDGGLHCFTGTRLKGHAELQLVQPAQLDMFNHLTGSQGMITLRGARVFIPREDGSINSLSRLSIALDQHKPPILTPLDLEGVLSAMAGWYRTATGALVPEPQFCSNHESWLRSTSEIIHMGEAHLR